MGAGWSKEVFANNLKHYMESFGKNQREMADIVGVSAPTFNEWIRGKKYPRIDKIEKLAHYFGILKSDLIEERTPEREAIQKKSSTVADAVLKMKSEDEFLTVIEEVI